MLFTRSLNVNALKIRKSYLDKMHVITTKQNHPGPINAVALNGNILIYQQLLVVHLVSQHWHLAFDK